MTEKKSKRDKKFSVEELYQNKNFVPPKEKNLETIFEEPRKSKDGMPILTSVRKYRRYLHFDPTEGKIQKRKRRAKKCTNKIRLNQLKTRSSDKTVRDEDISLYILETLGESSDSDQDIAHHEPELTAEVQKKTNRRNLKKISKKVISRKKTGTKKTVQEISEPSPTPESSKEETSDPLVSQDIISTTESQQSTKTEILPEDPKDDLCPEKLELPKEEPSRRSSCTVN